MSASKKETAGGELDLSIAVVAYRVREELERCLNSIEAALQFLPHPVRHHRYR